MNEWILISDRLPPQQARCLFVASDWGKPPMVFFGYLFLESWFVDMTFYGDEGPDRHAPEEILCWFEIPPVPENYKFSIRRLKLKVDGG